MDTTVLNVIKKSIFPYSYKKSAYQSSHPPFSAAIARAKGLASAKCYGLKAQLLSYACEDITREVDRQWEGAAHPALTSNQVVSLLSYVFFRAKIPNLFAELFIIQEWV